MAIEDIQSRLRDFEEGKREVSPDDRGMLRDVRGFISRALQGGDPESAPILERVGRDWALDLLYNRWTSLSEELIRLNHRLQDTYHVHNGARRRSALKSVVREIFDPEVEQSYYRTSAKDLDTAVSRALRAAVVEWVARQGRLSPLMFMERLSELHLLTDDVAPKLTSLGRYFLTLDRRRGMSFLLLCDLAVGSLSVEAARSFLDGGRSFRSKEMTANSGLLTLEQCEWLVAIGVAGVEEFQYHTIPPGFLALRSALMELDGAWAQLIQNMASLEYKLERPREGSQFGPDKTLQNASAWFGRALEESLRPLQTHIALGKRLSQGQGELAQNIEDLQGQLNQVDALAHSFVRYMRSGEAAPDLLSVDEVIAEVLAQWRGRNPSVQIEVDVELHLPAITGSREDFKRALTQLLDNAAVAGTGENPARIRILAQGLEGGGRLRLTVSDAGEGVPESMRARLFEPGVSMKSGHRGLGLAFVRRVVRFDFMGEIVYAPNIAGGSDFTMIIPTIRTEF